MAFFKATYIWNMLVAKTKCDVGGCLFIYLFLPNIPQTWWYEWGRQGYQNTPNLNTWTLFQPNTSNSVFSFVQQSINIYFCNLVHHWGLCFQNYKNILQQCNNVWNNINILQQCINVWNNINILQQCNNVGNNINILQQCINVWNNINILQQCNNVWNNIKYSTAMY